MGKRLTVAELSQQLEASHISYQKLLDEVASLKATLVAAPTVPTATVAKATVRAPRADITCPKCSGTGFYDQATGAICFQCDEGVQNKGAADAGPVSSRLQAHVFHPSRQQQRQRNVDVEALAAAGEQAALFGANVQTLQFGDGARQCPHSVR